jgi:hypothetical protein
LPRRDSSIEGRLRMSQPAASSAFTWSIAHRLEMPAASAMVFSDG